MRTEREFYNQFVETIDNNIEELYRISGDIERLEKRKNSNRYKEEYIRNEVDPQIRSLKKEMEERRKTGKKEVEDLCEEYRRELLEADSLKGSELTDDARLLSLGIPLSKKDLSSMLSRNPNNGTMLQLILKYAAEHEINLGVEYVGHSGTIEKLGGLPHTAEVALKWYESNDVYNQLIGEGSELSRLFPES